MPNWCECDLTFNGPIKAVDNLLQSIKSDRSLFDFDKVIPYPERYKQLTLKAQTQHEALKAMSDEERKSWLETNEYPKDGFNQGGYEWCVQNWGTKWWVDDIEIEQPYDYEDTRQITLHFSTAWSPPNPVILEMSRQHPDVEIDLRYFEGGMGFNGWYQCKAGEVLHDETGKYFGNRGG